MTIDEARRRRRPGRYTVEELARRSACRPATSAPTRPGGCCPAGPARPGRGSTTTATCAGWRRSRRCSGRGTTWSSIEAILGVRGQPRRPTEALHRAVAAPGRPSRPALVHALTRHGVIGHGHGRQRPHGPAARAARRLDLHRAGVHAVPSLQPQRGAGQPPSGGRRPGRRRHQPRSLRLRPRWPRRARSSWDDLDRETVAPDPGAWSGCSPRRSGSPWRTTAEAHVADLIGEPGRRGRAPGGSATIDNG